MYCCICLFFSPHILHTYLSVFTMDALTKREKRIVKTVETVTDGSGTETTTTTTVTTTTISVVRDDGTKFTSTTVSTEGPNTVVRQGYGDSGCYWDHSACPTCRVVPDGLRSRCGCDTEYMCPFCDNPEPCGRDHAAEWSDELAQQKKPARDQMKKVCAELVCRFATM